MEDPFESGFNKKSRSTWSQGGNSGSMISPQYKDDSGFLFCQTYDDAFDPQACLIVTK